MGENRSLDDFFSAGDDDGASDGPDDGDGARDDPDDGDGARDDHEDDEPVSDTESETTATTDGEPVREASAEDTVEDSDVAENVDAESPAVSDERTDRDETPVDPPRATYRWIPGGEDCPACGATVDAQWRDGERFVCADCKEW